MNFTLPALTLGWILALLVFIAAFVLVLVGRMDLLTGVLLMALALARMVP